MASDWPAGCRFHPRCPDAVPECGVAPPSPGPDPARVVRCLLVHSRTEQHTGPLDDEDNGRRVERVSQ